MAQSMNYPAHTKKHMRLSPTQKMVKFNEPKSLDNLLNICPLDILIWFIVSDFCFFSFPPDSLMLYSLLNFDNFFIVKKILDFGFVKENPPIHFCYFLYILFYPYIIKQIYYYLIYAHFLQFFPKKSKFWKKYHIILKGKEF